jgi:hypothetical protein
MQRRITEEYCNSLNKGTLVYIIWSGGNKGLYRVEKDQYNRSYAVNAAYYNDDGTERNAHMIGALRYYNSINSMDVQSIEIK